MGAALPPRACPALDGILPSAQALHPITVETKGLSLIRNRRPPEPPANKHTHFDAMELETLSSLLPSCSLQR